MSKVTKKMLSHVKALELINEVREILWPPPNPSEPWTADTIEYVAMCFTQRGIGAPPCLHVPVFKLAAKDAITIEVVCNHCNVSGVLSLAESPYKVRWNET